MEPEAFWIAAAGFLLALEPGSEFRTPRWTRVLYGRFTVCLEILFQLLAAAGAALLAARYVPEEQVRSFWSLGFTLWAFAWVLLRRGSGVLFAVSLILGFSAAGFKVSAAVLVPHLLKVACGTALFTLLLLCAQRRLLFSQVPRAFQGLTAVFLAAALLALGLHALEGLFWF